MILLLIDHSQIRATLEEKEGKTFDRFVAVKYCTQVVAGVNYFIKVQINRKTSNRLLAEVLCSQTERLDAREHFLNIYFD